MNAGSADREVSSISRSAARINGDLQRQVLHILQSPAANVCRGSELLPETRRHARGRE